MPITNPTGVQHLRATNMDGSIGVANQLGVFCISVDTEFTEADSAAIAQRRQDVLKLLQRFRLPSNWTTNTPPKRSVPDEMELSLTFPKQVTRADLIDQIRKMNASLARDGSHLQSVMLDPHEARTHWDLLVRQGCHVVRPRTMAATSEKLARVIRGGLWYAPLSCSFVGGSRRSVRSLFSVCQRHLVASTNQGGLFHLNVDVGNSRSSWKEEIEALGALLQTALELQNKSRLRCIKLSDLPASLSRKSTVPMSSVLRRAA